MKKRIKKYNPRRVLSIIDKTTIDNSVLLMRLDATEGKVVLYDLNHNKEYTPNPSQYNLFNKHRYNWLIFLATWYRESNGKDRFSVVPVTINVYAKHTDLVGQLNTLHQAQIKSLSDRGNIITNAGWAAYAGKPKIFNSLSEEEIQDFTADLIQDFRPYKKLTVEGNNVFIEPI